MKDGEIYYCIKDRFDKRDVVNYSGRYYAVELFVDRKGDVIDNLLIHNIDTVWMENELDGSYYYVFQGPQPLGIYMFSDHFISKQDLRKYKLENIEYEVSSKGDF